MKSTKNVKRYTLGFKQSVVAEFMLGQSSRQELCLLHGIGLASLDRWRRALHPEGGVEIIDVPFGSMAKKKDSTPKAEEMDLAELHRRISELEVKLLNAELRAKAAELTIEIAERDLGLEIRKKFATKPSGK